MQKLIRQTFCVAIVLCLQGCESTAMLDDLLTSAGGSSAISNTTIAQGMREALTVGSTRAVDTLGREGGFANSAFHIPLPAQLQDAKQFASRFGLAGPFEELELKMNLAAEAAVPEARDLFVSAIRTMTFEDVMAIYRGPDDAATQYLQQTTRTSLDSRLRPIINTHLNSVGAVRTFRQAVDQYNAIPLVKPIDADLNGHVSGYAMDALFSQLATEEAAIRKDPLKRTTQLLRTVFGA
ncbi:MAG: DUF4197 domain-containing protein [bacterium]